KLERAFKLGNYKVTPYLWVKNLLDRKNVVNAWEGTGKANTTAWLETDAGMEFVETYSEPSDHAELTGQQKYDLAQAPPNNYGTPRQIFFGLRMSF
ncbi:MAG: hypothetical protein KAW91_06190, partial [candidate division Zixibacteria bacterium]|nr:hypothetical protein [candidate division Zixibacteria bacterium]